MKNLSNPLVRNSFSYQTSIISVFFAYDFLVFACYFLSLKLCKFTELDMYFLTEYNEKAACDEPYNTLPNCYPFQYICGYMWLYLFIFYMIDDLEWSLWLTSLLLNLLFWLNYNLVFLFMNRIWYWRKPESKGIISFLLQILVW